MTKTFKQKRAADSFASKQRTKGYYASVYEEPIDPHASTRRKRGQKRYYVEYGTGASLMGNPTMRRRKQKNPPHRKNAGLKSKLLKNFTGVVRLNADKTVSIVGTGKKANPSRKRAKRRAKR
jgi:hypothetical protein